MGFGLLFIGYALAFAFSISAPGGDGTLSAVPYFFSDVVGALVMTYAFSKLSAYDKKFRFAFVSALVFALLCALGAINRFVIGSAPALYVKILEALVAASIIVLHFTMFLSIVSISRSVGLDKIAFKARRNLIVMILYFTLYTLTLLMRSYLETSYPNAAKYVYVFLTLFQFVWLFLNLILIGSCLKWIGEEGEGTVDPNPSKLKKLYSKWSEKEDRIYTPKERRSGNDKKKK
jgi:hypothetical protein